MKAARAVLTVALLALATTATAQQKGTVDKTIESASKGDSTYGMAGCGLGSMIFGSDPSIVSQVLAATTNGLGYQTFAISTGTSNCTPGAGARGARLFIEANQEALAKDASRGGGETIVTLSQIVGCKDPQAVGAKLQQNFSQVFPTANAPAEVVAENVLDTLKSDPSLACSDIG